ncbi:MAG: Na(+)-translocating NADH-quinone reductase subunit E [Acidobacteria bacterium]|nr:Na(+)-translocating NADH-quinone reductase subunit E [Acidobacteriota bacterium]
MSVILVTIGAFAVIMLAMAVGVIIQKKSLRGSCGGAEVFDCDGESLSCGACPNRKKKEPRKAHPAELLRELTGQR